MVRRWGGIFAPPPVIWVVKKGPVIIGLKRGLESTHKKDIDQKGHKDIRL